MRLLMFLILFGLCGSATAQTTYRDELKRLADVSDLPAYRTEPLGQESSYDRTGGNNDGFSGQYSFVRKEGDELVIADLKGPGVINRIWTPTPAADTIRFYFDGETVPRINMPFIDMFSGERYPFVAPLCDSEVGGFVCYLPIPYAKSLKIVYKGSGLKFHQVQYRTLDAKSNIESYSDELVRDNQDVLDRVAQVWTSRVKPMDEGVKKHLVQLTLKPGEVKSLFSLTGGGRIVGIELNALDGLRGADRDIILSAKWDGQQANAMELPMADFFGYAYGKPAMRGFLCGAVGNDNYCYLPMPFDRSAEMNVSYLKRDTEAKDCHIVATIYYTDQKRDPKREGRFYAQWRRERPAQGVPYTIANIRGRGHYVGTSLIAQGMEGGMTLFWEGDDRSIVDGKLTMHGTGSEDYFNGGWYAVTDRWDRGISCPMHGALDYDIKMCRTGGYRFFAIDKINFEKSYNLTMEHGPEGDLLDVDYWSVAYFYGEAPQFENEPLSVHNRSLPEVNKCVVLAQDFTVRPYWSSSVALGDGYMDIRSVPSDNWTTNIDFEAVPMAQFDLRGVAHGRYKLSVVYSEASDGGEFAVWQRTKPLSDWIATIGSADKPIAVAVGEIVVDDQLSTITLRRRKTADTAVRINMFVLEKVR